MKRLVFWAVALVVIAGVVLWAMSRQGPRPELSASEALYVEAGTPLADEHGEGTLIWRGTIRNAGRAGRMTVTVSAGDGAREWSEVKTIELDAGAQEVVVIPLARVPADAGALDVDVKIDPAR